MGRAQRHAGRPGRARGSSRARALVSLIALAYGPGCVPRPEDRPPASAPVEHPAQRTSAAPAPDAIRYTLELLEPETPLVGVHVEVRGDADGTSEFTLDEGWAGIAESGKDLELVEARGARDELASERVNSFTW